MVFRNFDTEMGEENYDFKGKSVCFRDTGTPMTIDRSVL